MAVDFRYRGLGYITLQVSDIEKSSDFATNVFGMDAAGEGEGGARFFRVGPKNHDIMLVPADKPAFARSSWELETEDDLDKAFRHYNEIGLSPAWVSDNECSSLRLERAFRVVEPKLRTTWEYYARMSSISTPCTNKLTRFQGGKHYGLIVPDCKEVSDYMVENMGFRVSDYMEGWGASLLRAYPNPNHHSIAPLKFPTPHPTFHHIAFMVEEIDDIGRLFNRIKRHDVNIQWGIGRHPTSLSIFLYIYDHDYFVWEYTLGMEQFPEVGAREPRRMSSAREDLDLWGAVPDLQHIEKFPGILSS
jgi:2,3-dihydroxy-p-cumate/2,3-dihydroxybenzoate 3,4-dioxygenase